MKSPRGVEKKGISHSIRVRPEETHVEAVFTQTSEAAPPEGVRRRP